MRACREDGTGRLDGSGGVRERRKWPHLTRNRTLALLFALEFEGDGAFYPQVPPLVVEERHRVRTGSRRGVHAGQVEVVVARRVDVDEGAFEAGNCVYQNG